MAYKYGLVYLHKATLVCLLLFFFMAVKGFCQQQTIEKLELKEHNIYSSITSKTSYCLDNIFQDSYGKLWLSTCFVSSYGPSGLLYFDGYSFTSPKPKPSLLSNLSKHYIGIVNNKIYGYAKRNSTNYLFYYDLDKNAYSIYDSIYTNSFRLPEYKSYNNDAYYPVFQNIKNDNIYTYLRQNNKVRLLVYSSSGTKLSYPFVDLPQHTVHPIRFMPGTNVNAEWYYGVDNYQNTLVALNLKTGVPKRIAVPLDISAYADQTTPAIGISGPKIILSFIKKNEKIVYMIFESKPEAGLEHIKTLEGGLVRYFSNAREQLIYKYFDVEKNKFQLSINTEGKEYNANAVLDILDGKTINHIQGDDYTKELKVLTNDALYVFNFKNTKGVEILNIDEPVRGIGTIEDDKLIYLAETGINTIKAYDLKTNTPTATSTLCGFNHVKLLEKNEFIWGTTRDGIAKYNTKTQSCTVIPLEQDIFNFTLDQNNNIIMMDDEFNYWLMDKDTSKVTPILHEETPLQKGDFYTDFIVDKAGVLWIASPKGLYKYNFKERKLTNINSRLDDFNFGFISFAEGKENELWLGSNESGVIILNTRDLSFKQLNTDQGLCNNNIASITKDNAGLYWIGTYNGVALANAEGQLLKNLYEEDGLVHNECNRHSAKLLKDGRLALGTIDGISLIDTKTLTENIELDNRFNLYLSELSNYSSTDREFKTYTHGFKSLDTITLTPGNKNLALKFGTTNYSSPGKNTFSYKINGIHDSWINIGTNNSLFLSGLPSGNYILNIQAYNKSGFKSGNVLKFYIISEEFFYKELWFYLLVIFIICMITLSIIMLLNNRIKNATQQINADKEKIQKQAEQLKLIDKAKNEFFTNITHEFRTPLTIIKGLTELIEQNNGKATVKDIKNLKYNSEGLFNLVNNILDLRKLESNKIELSLKQADIVLYIDYLLDAHQYLANNKHIELKFEHNVDTLFMDFDPELLKTVMTNLICNAIKYTPDFGKITVDIKKHVRRPNVSITVKDTGIGFKNEDIENVLNLYKQSENHKAINEKGYGIGLYLSKKIIELMKGTIQVKETSDEGSSFLIDLPITKNATIENLNSETRQTTTMPIELPQDNANASTSKFSRQSKTKILIVDDNTSIQHLLNSQLNGYTLFFANDGEDGIEKAILEMPDIIISDVMMPNKNGYELCEVLKADIRTSHIPIILLTAKADHQSKIEGFKARADAYIYKPFDFEELHLQLQNLIESRNALHKTYKTLKQNSAPTGMPGEDEFIITVRQLIIKNLTNDNFGIDAIYHQMNVSRAHLYNKIKALTGLSVANYINSVKLQVAKDLLNDTDSNISEIAFKVGIKEPAYFSKLFKNEFGLSPKEYRERFVQDEI
jgi:signal transduction histidine kinase/AraC-like DNA-binding protein/ligand-binding sensor domain-containing protein